MEVWSGISGLFGFKQEAVLTLHGASDFNCRHQPTFETHNPTSMG
jgi:hypothetical protein